MTALASAATGVCARDVDISFLNASEVPAGKHGFLHARGERLVFDDGVVPRFWGTNLTANALFQTSHENVRLQARRLSELGFNLVRLHHHDSAWVKPNIFGAADVRSTRALNAEMQDRIDWWIKCLKDQGIYVWLDLHVGRRLLPGDGIDAFEEIRTGEGASLFGYNYVNASIRGAMQRFNAQYLEHRNTYTGLRYVDEAAIAALLITNENDLTNHFGNALLPNQHVPEHNAIYMREAEAFAGRYSLPAGKVWRSWEPGPAKLFLNDLERRFDVEMIAHLRGLGVRPIIVTTNTWGLNPLSSLPALTAGDAIDVHAYGATGELAKDPNTTANLVHWLAAARVAGKPLTVTEWGVEEHGAPTADRQDIALYVAAAASLQGWSAVMHYAYSYEPLDSMPGSVSAFNAHDDEAMLATLSAAALLYRRADVAEASSAYVFAPDARQLIEEAISPANSVALRTAAERGRLFIALPKLKELPWLAASPIPEGATLIRDPGQSLNFARDSEIVSDSGELRRNWRRGVFTVDTPRSQAAMGAIGGQTISLSQIELATSVGDAAVAVQSLEQRPIGRSTRLLISLHAGAGSGGDLAAQEHPLGGLISVTGPPGLRLLIWDAARGSARPAPKPAYRNGRYRISLDTPLGSSWLLLSK